nr:hypothetical protein [uncultured Mucilaginibacter sp.]
MKKVFLVLSMVISCGFCSAQVKPLNDGNYLIAQQKLKQGDILTAYKNFLIFEYLNYERINLPVNRDAKTKLEAKIKELEEYLSQSNDILSIKIGRGWSDSKADSVMNAKKEQISRLTTSIPVN